MGSTQETVEGLSSRIPPQFLCRGETRLPGSPGPPQAHPSHLQEPVLAQRSRCRRLGAAAARRRAAPTVDPAGAAHTERPRWPLCASPPLCRAPAETQRILTHCSRAPRPALDRCLGLAASKAVGALAAPAGPAAGQRAGAGHAPTRGQGEVQSRSAHRGERRD